jgi:short subunit dehydrogenase-like uncharacterized protein
MSKKTNKPYAITVLGSTGFTGKLVVEYLANKLANTPEPNLTADQIALAGRNKKKLEEIASKIAEKYSVKFSIVEADADDAKSIDTMVQNTKVVLSTAGPFAKFGSVVVDACVRNSVHYCDISGEFPWVGEMIQKHCDEEPSFDR